MLPLPTFSSAPSGRPDTEAMPSTGGPAVPPVQVVAEYTRAGVSTLNERMGFSQNPPNDVTPKSPIHAHFVLLAGGSPAGGSKTKGGSYLKPRSR